jgi:hypothetical protein
MSGGITFESGIINRKATPAIMSDDLANRPASGPVGLLFLANDSPNIGWSRWNGSAWIDITGSGSVPSSRQLTIAGVTQDLSADRTWLALAPGGNTYAMNFKIGTDDNFTISFKTNGTDRLTIDTGSPSTATWTTKTMNFTAGTGVILGTTDAFGLSFKTNGTLRLTIDNGGGFTFTGSSYSITGTGTTILGIKQFALDIGFWFSRGQTLSHALVFCTANYDPTAPSIEADKTSKSFLFLNATAVDLVGTVKTAQPSASGAGVWKLGKFVSGAVTLDGANYIEVDIDGTIRKILVST